MQKPQDLNWGSIVSALGELSDPIFRPAVDEEFILSGMMLDVYNGIMAKAIAERQTTILFGYTQAEEAIYGATAPVTQLQVRRTLEQYFLEHVVTAAMPFYLRGDDLTAN